MMEGFWAAAFRAAVRLYPPAFRHTLGTDMARALEEQRLLRLRRHGQGRALAFALRALVAALFGAALERLHEWRHDAGRSRASRMSPTSTTGGVGTMIDELRQDLRLLFRHFARRPAFAVIVVVTLALGIGVTTGVFSVVRGVLLRPLPYPDSDQLVYLWGGGASSIPNFQDLGERLETLEDVSGVWVPFSMTLTGSGEPAELSVSLVSRNFFPMLGVAPAVGRLLRPDDDGTLRIVLSHALWVTRFGSDPDVVGQSLTLDGDPFEVVGVAPASLEAPFDADLLGAFPWGPEATPRVNRKQRAAEVYGRITDGHTLDEVRSEVATEWARLQNEYPDANDGWRVVPRGLREAVTGNEATPLTILFWASVLFLLVASANVGGLFLSRLESREREFAVRSALGAGRGRLLRQAGSEALMLGLLGGTLGVLLAVAFLDTSLSVFGSSLSRLQDVRIDGTVLLFSLATSVGTGLLVGAITAVAWRRDAPAAALGRTARGGGRRTTKLRRVLVWGEVGMSLMVVTGLALLVRSFIAVQSVDMGVDANDVLVVQLGDLPAASYPDPSSRNAFTHRLGDRMAAIPGVESVAFASRAPLGGCCNNGPWNRADNPDLEHDFVELRVVTPGYFQTLGVPVREGRALEPSDGPGDVSVVVVNETLARALWPDGDAVGGRIHQGGTENDFQVVGVVGDVREYSPERDAPPIVYLPMDQTAWRLTTVVIRTGLTTDAAAGAIRTAVHELEPLVPVASIRPLGDIESAMTADRRATTYLMALMGALAFLLGGIGVYGVMSHTVLGRLKEIGVRMALGAPRESVLKRVIRQGIGLVIPGVILGTAGALAAHGVLDSLLFGVGPFDLWTYATVVLAFIAVAVLAALGPARRASRVDPVKVLKQGE